MQRSLLTAAGILGAGAVLGALYLWRSPGRRRGRCQEQLPQAAARIGQAIDEHRYQEAAQQLDIFLRLLPEEPELAALKARLDEALAEYGSDPSRAERARQLMQQAAASLKNGLPPGPEELLQLQALPSREAKYLCARSRAKETQSRLLDHEAAQDAARADETRRALERLSGLAERGQPRAALSEAKAQGRDSQAMAAFVSELECRISYAQTAADAVSRRLESADTAGAKRALAELVDADAEHALGRKLLAAMDIMDEATPRLLKPRKAGKPVVLMHRRAFIVGRDPSKGAILVIEDGRVSRAHLKFSILDDHLYAEDLDTPNGSYIGQGRFTHVAARDGDSIKLSLAVPIEVHVSYNWEAVAGFRGNRPAEQLKVTIPGRPTDRKHGKVQGVFLDFPGYAVLWGRMPVALGPAGLQFNRKAKTELCYRDGVLLFGHGGQFRPVFPGEALEDADGSYLFAG